MQFTSTQNMKYYFLIRHSFSQITPTHFIHCEIYGDDLVFKLWYCLITLILYGFHFHTISIYLKPMLKLHAKIIA